MLALVPVCLLSGLFVLIVRGVQAGRTDVKSTVVHVHVPVSLTCAH